ncbi:unnamed protein product [Schistosoma turkestanicum]|nr:unnamed protein product [Schistosoma turkestanicum]
MTSQYTGFKVELTSSELGKIVGVVSNVTDKKISLINAVINNYPPTIPSFAVESKFIQNIRILSTASNGESSGSDTPVKGPNKSSNSSREQRREWLRNIPNACSVYVCPDSPPIIHKTTGAPGSGSNIHDFHNGLGHSNDLQQLDNALAKASIREPNDFSPARKYGVNNHRHAKRRSYSLSEAAGTSDISGGESDSFHRYTNSGSKGQFNCGGGGNTNRHAQNRSHPRSNNNHNHRSGGNTGLNGSGAGSGGQRNLADWDRICVEEFIDEDFDFEGNLALFNKSAFYEMVDLREGHSITHTSEMNNSSVSSSLPHFIEGPDGVGIPLFTTPTSQPSNLTRTTTMTAATKTTMTITAAGCHHEDKNKMKNAQTTTSSNKSIDYDPTSPIVVAAEAGIVHSKDKAIQENDLNGNVNKLCHINSMKRNNQWWYTCTGQRVPICQLEQRQRLLHYLATGLDLDNQIKNNLLMSNNAVSTTTARSKFQGLTWGRLIESATRPLVDNIMMHLRQSNRTPQRIIHKPPARILIISNGSNHLGAILSLNLARYLSTLGACVLLVTSSMYNATSSVHSNHTNNAASATTPPEDVYDEYPTDTSIMSTLYRQELHLLKNLAPKPNQYGLDDVDDDDEDESERYNDDESGTDNENNRDDNGNSINDNNNNVSTGISFGNVGEQNDIDFDSMSCHNHSDISSIVDHSSVGRIWMSRMPGLKIIRRPNSVTKLPSSIRIDLVIIGHPDDIVTVNKNNTSSPSNTNLLPNWLRNHNSIGGIIHLTPSQSIVDSNILLKNAQHFVWLIELGLPILTPQCYSTSSSAAAAVTTPTLSVPPADVILNNSNNSTPINTFTQWLIDIGLGRNIVRKLIGDLNLLPPYGLFDLASMIPLRATQLNSVQQQQQQQHPLR